MNYELTWQVPHHVLIITFDERITLYDMRQMRGEVFVALENSQADNHYAQQHLIVDVRESRDFPLDIQETFQAFLGNIHPNIGWICLVSDNRIHNMIASSVAQLIGVKLSTVHTMRDAMRFLTERDPSLQAYLVS